MITWELGVKEGCTEYFDNNRRAGGKHYHLELAVPRPAIGYNMMFLLHEV